VLAHEANIDALWDTSLRPLLARRFPRATRDDGGAVARLRLRWRGDSGSRLLPVRQPLFSATCCTTSGAAILVEALLRESQDVDEYAFALGALAHYAADNVGHPEAVNRAVALMYPKLARQVWRLGDLRRRPGHARARRVFLRRGAGGERRLCVGHVPELHRVSGGPNRSSSAHSWRPTPRDEGRVPGRGSGDRLVPPRESARRSPRSRASPGATSARRSRSSTLAQRRRNSFSTCRRRNTTNRTAGSTRGRACWRGFWRCSTSCCRRSGRCASWSSRRRPRRPRRSFSRASRTRASANRAALDALGRGRPRSGQHQFRHRQAQRPRRLHAGPTTPYAELLDRLTGHRLVSVPDALRQNINAFYAAAPDRFSDKKERKRAAQVRKNLALLNTKDTKARPDR